MSRRNEPVSRAAYGRNGGDCRGDSRAPRSPRASLSLAADPVEPRYAEGGTIFQANCAVCHGAKGLGQPSLAPPLTSYPARYATIAEGRRQLAITVLNGMFGGIDVESKHYDFKMPEFLATR